MRLIDLMGDVDDALRESESLIAYQRLSEQLRGFDRLFGPLDRLAEFAKVLR